MNTRRNFIRQSAAASAAFFLQPDIMTTLNFPESNRLPREQLLIFATNWGFKGSLDEYGAMAKEAGYDGIEIWWPTKEEDQTELYRVLRKYALAVGFLSGTGSSDFRQHKDEFDKMVRAAAFNSVQKPVYINCHSGRDFFQMEENLQLIDITEQLQKASGINIYHETHRSRMLFAAPIARQYFQKSRNFGITLDISHWYNVSESFLEDQQPTVEEAIARTGHIHARIGHPEGPQVNDPRAPEWAHALETHLACWDKVALNKKKNGEVMTILTEFGPPNYLPTKPYSQEPLADQWEINVYMLNLLRKRYQS